MKKELDWNQIAMNTSAQEQYGPDTLRQAVRQECLQKHLDALCSWYATAMFAYQTASQSKDTDILEHVDNTQTLFFSLVQNTQKFTR